MTTPKFLITPNIVEEEISYLIHLTTRKNFFDKKGDKYHYIKDKEIITWLEKASKNKDTLNSEKIVFQKYKQKYYKEDSYNNTIKSLNNNMSKLLYSWDKVTDELSNVNFKYFNKYSIKVTNLEPGGSYNSTQGKIILLNTPFRFSNRPIFQSLIHEFIHIGIQKNYIEKYNISHKDKEHFVDLLCKYQMKEVLPDYQMQGIKNKRLESLFFKYGFDNGIKNYANIHN